MNDTERRWPPSAQQLEDQRRRYAAPHRVEGGWQSNLVIMGATHPVTPGELTYGIGHTELDRSPAAAAARYRGVLDRRGLLWMRPGHRGHYDPGLRPSPICRYGMGSIHAECPGTFRSPAMRLTCTCSCHARG